jgi:hypothetical protein
MTPRFAARWAEAARERAARQPQPAAAPVQARPTFEGAPAPAPSLAAPATSALSFKAPAPVTAPGLPASVEPAPPRMPTAPSPAAQPEPPPPSFDAPTEPMGLDPADREHVDIALFDEAPHPPEAPGASQAASGPASPQATEGAAPAATTRPSAFAGLEDERSDAEAAAAALAAEFAAPQVTDESPAEPAEPAVAAPVAAGIPPTRGTDAEHAGVDVIPPADEEEVEDDDVVGPPTLASMLPDPVATWPPRSRRGRKRTTAPKPPAAAEDAAAPALESQGDRHHPRFVREAHRDARWSRPAVRAGLGVALAVLVVAAAAQASFPWRDTIASRWPATAPLWEAACEQLGCRIEAPRAIASLTLDGSSLTRTDVDRVLLFSADLHNRSDHAVRMPSFDLSFMDLNGQIVARKVLDPSQIGIRQGALGPEGELHVHARIQVDGLEASGFQAEMFYP